jgi:hypothetical protein
MSENRSAAAELEAASPRDLRALVPVAREPEAAPDETDAYIAELLAQAPPLPAKLTALLSTP